MTDKQLKDYVKKRTVDELIGMLISYGKAVALCESMKIDLKEFDTIERLIDIVKKEIHDRVMFEF